MPLKPATKQLRSDIRHDLRELGLYPPPTRIKPAQAPHAEYVNSKIPGEIESRKFWPVGTYIGKLKAKSEVLWVIATIMYESGCRVSEILNVTWIDISETGKVKVKGSKRSSDRFISTGDAAEYLKYCKASGIHPFDGLSYDYVYREFKKVGLFIQSGTGGKSKVTHLFRHMFVDEMRSVGVEAVDQSRVIGHKNVKSTEYYGIKTKK